MNVTDPIADMLTRIRNAVRANHDEVVMPTSKMKTDIAKILKDEGYILNYKVEGEAPKKQLVVSLRYGKNDEKVIKGLKRISTPGLRVYAKCDKVPRVLNGLGIAIISTSQGLLTDKDARKNKAGGEVVAYVW